jgi:hypothetical protein
MRHVFPSTVIALLFLGSSALAHDDVGPIGAIAPSPSPHAQLQIAEHAGHDNGQQNAGHHHVHWVGVGCVSSADHCHHDAHEKGYEHSRVVPDHHACHHEPHLLCQARK